MSALFLVALAGVLAGSWLYRVNNRYRAVVEDVI
jgi:hypothetical protein